MLVIVLPRPVRAPMAGSSETVSTSSNGSPAGDASISHFFERPILNNPYEYPRRHWELDGEGQPTHRILDGRRPAEFITPFPTAQQHGASSAQARLRIDPHEELSTDTDYDEESFFVRHAYFLGARDPYKSLKTSLKSEIDKEAWASLHRARSRPFPKPQTGRIAVKVINHLGDEAMKVFRVS